MGVGERTTRGRVQALFRLLKVPFSLPPPFPASFAFSTTRLCLFCKSSNIGLFKTSLISPPPMTLAPFGWGWDHVQSVCVHTGRDSLELGDHLPQSRSLGPRQKLCSSPLGFPCQCGHKYFEHDTNPNRNPKGHRGGTSLTLYSNPSRPCKLNGLRANPTLRWERKCQGQGPIGVGVMKRPKPLVRFG